MSVWLGPLAGLTPGGLPFLVSLFGSCPPRRVCGWQSPVCFSLGTPCALFDCWGQVFLLVFTLLQVCSLFQDWVSCPFLFSQASFVSFLPVPDSLALVLASAVRLLVLDRFRDG